ncbi:hypothetical protein L210DRAFT_3562157, partial [Boletus edulis BED1]
MRTVYPSPWSLTLPRIATNGNPSTGSQARRILEKVKTIAYPLARRTQIRSSGSEGIRGCTLFIKCGADFPS